MAKRTTPVTVEQVAAQFDRGVAALDQLRARQIAEGVRLESAKAAVRAREHERLLRKYGDRHPRTQAVAQRLTDSGAYLAELVREYDRASTPQPDPRGGWAVDGFVRTVAGGPVPRITVAAADRQGRWLPELGHTCTNERGYFQLIVEKLPEEALRVYLRAFQRGEVLASNENRLAPAAGRADRVDIVIDRSGRGDCQPPEGTAPAPPPEPAAPAAQARTPRRTAGPAGETAPDDDAGGARPQKKRAPARRRRAAKPGKKRG